MKKVQILMVLLTSVFFSQANANNYAAAKADSYFEEYPEEYENYDWQRDEGFEYDEYVPNPASAKADSYFEEYPEEYENYAWQREKTAQEEAEDAASAAAAAIEEAALMYGE